MSCENNKIFLLILASIVFLSCSVRTSYGVSVAPYLEENQIELLNSEEASLDSESTEQMISEELSSNGTAFTDELRLEIDQLRVELKVLRSDVGVELQELRKKKDLDSRKKYYHLLSWGTKLAVLTSTALAIKWYGPAYLEKGTKKLFPIIYKIMFGNLPLKGPFYYLNYLTGMRHVEKWVEAHSAPILTAIGGVLLPVAYSGCSATIFLGKMGYFTVASVGAGACQVGRWGYKKIHTGFSP